MCIVFNSFIQTGYAMAAKHLEQLWDSVDEEVLAGAVLVPLRPDPATVSATISGTVNTSTGTAFYPGTIYIYVSLLLLIIIITVVVSLSIINF